MKRIVAALVGLLALALPSAALAQCSGIFTAGYFCGNSAAGGGLAGAASPTAMFDRAFGGTNNSTVVRLGGVWTVLSSANSGVWITSVAGVPSISSTLPNAVQDNITRLGTIANVGAPIGATFGGTGKSSYAVGDILYADTISTLARLADVATGSALISGGVNTAFSWGKIGLTTHVSGQLPLGNGGCNGTTAATCLNNIMPTPTRAGDVAYWNGSAWITLAGNNSGTNVLTENSSGVPSWSAPGTGTVTSAQIIGAGLSVNSGTCTITTTGACTVTTTAATQADQETSTSTTTAVTPGRQQFHPSAAKAWARFTGSTGALIASYNLSSVTRNSTGNYNFNFTTSFSSATSYACNLTVDGVPQRQGQTQAASLNSASAMRGVTYTTAGAESDPTEGILICFGDQ